jgi:hypothetical protein
MRLLLLNFINIILGTFCVVFQNRKVRMKMAATRSSETLLPIYQITQRHTPRSQQSSRNLFVFLPPFLFVISLPFLLLIHLPSPLFLIRYRFHHPSLSHFIHFFFTFYAHFCLFLITHFIFLSVLFLPPILLLYSAPT